MRNNLLSAAQNKYGVSESRGSRHLHVTSSRPDPTDGCIRPTSYYGRYFWE